MSYEYIDDEEYKDASKIAWNFIDKLQTEFKGTLKFDKKLIGSSKYKLVCKRGSEPFDFDFQLYITKIYDGKLKNDNNKLREEFITRINKIKDENGFTYKINNDSKVLRIKRPTNENNNNVWFWIEIVLIKKSAKKWLMLKFIKNQNKIIENELKKFNLNNAPQIEFNRIITIEKQRKDTDKELKKSFKGVYLHKKNNNEYNKKSFSLFKETIKEMKDNIN